MTTISPFFPQSSSGIDLPDIPRELIDEIKAGNVICFVGAGFSLPSGLPDWKNLLVKINARAQLDSSTTAEIDRLIDICTAESLDQAAQMIEDKHDKHKDFLIESLQDILKPVDPLVGLH
jgi:hypothetical protein